MSRPDVAVKLTPSTARRAVPPEANTRVRSRTSRSLMTATLGRPARARIHREAEPAPPPDGLAKKTPAKYRKNGILDRSIGE
nr:hypothetical protein GCM10025730_30680 [Promicromonospora thailandica]